MLAQSSGDLLHRLDSVAHRLAAPEVQKHAGPGERVVSSQGLGMAVRAFANAPLRM